MLRASLLLAFASAAYAAHAAPIPAEQFFKRPAITGAVMSPDGKWVAVRKLSPAGRSMLTIVDPETRTGKPIASFTNADVDLFYWVSDKRLFFTVTNVDREGDAGKPGLYAVDVDGKNSIRLSETLVRRPSFAENDLPSQTYLREITLHGFPRFKNEDLLVIESSPEGMELKRLDTHNGRLYDMRAPHGAFGWLFDANGDARVISAQRDNQILIYLRDKDEWRLLNSFDKNAPDGYEPLLYVDNALYVRARNGSNETGIYRYDVGEKLTNPKLLISAPGFDVSGYFDVSDTRMRGFRFYTDAEITVWFDAQMKAIQQEVDQLLPGMVNIVSRGARSETPYVIIDTHSDVQGHGYLLYNPVTKKQILLGEATPDIDPAQMSHMTMVRYKARDGMQIPMFVTAPGLPNKKNLPTVVLVAANPRHRNGLWQWNPEVQFLASRGYTVLQPDVRGSTGYGLQHSAAGDGQWGRAMQNDLADAVKWAAAEGYTDPARVCIAGSNLGGEAALIGLIQDPVVYKCGISWSGVARLLPQDTARLKQPVLLAYGKDDVEVPYAQGRKLYEAISAVNPGAEWLSYETTSEDRRTQKNRIDLWQRIDAFLAKNIGPQQAGR